MDRFQQSRQEFGQLVIAPPGAVSFGDDTRVNDLLTESANRGSLIAIDPESEFVTRYRRVNEKLWWELSRCRFITETRTAT